MSVIRHKVRLQLVAFVQTARDNHFTQQGQTLFFLLSKYTNTSTGEKEKGLGASTRDLRSSYACKQFREVIEIEIISFWGIYLFLFMFIWKRLVGQSEVQWQGCLFASTLVCVLADRIIFERWIVSAKAAVCAVTEGIGMTFFKLKGI